ncbi:Acyl-CoA synthetase (AMP-forming)/AMP-acid ligase II [Xaviernesmea oryzae]|uniref:3-methylmercaptopropionyl-CoA ligase n=2 Tax=Xaviernesmea oryzae TaxID=464029 RepID=A0A1X7CLC9_9HYPH|nr:Acyl-CoA synthetase (AMP-forming)/AMP-acid ligase II [Xaviernesmea oryzae]
MNVASSVAKAAPKGGLSPCSTRVMNLARFVTQAMRREPRGIALVWADKTWTWEEFEARIDAMAAALQQRFGVAKGDRILVQSQNCNQMFESMFACFRIGAVWVPTNFRQTPEEVAYLAKASGATGMICNASFPDHARVARETNAEIGFVVAIGEADFGPSYDAIVEEFYGRKPIEARVERDDPCWFFFTSGTTGRPKAAVLTHGQMAFVVNNHLCDLMPGVTSADAALVVAPLSHGAGVHQLTQVAHGVKTILLPTEKFDIETAWALIETWRVSTMFTVPTILKLLVEHPAAGKYDHSSLRYVIYAGAPMYREDQKRAMKTLGPVIVQYFGLGEVTGAITVLPPGLHSAEDGEGVKIGTCGIERTGMQVSIQNDVGDELGPYETGEICCIGPAVFAGYYDNPVANEKAFRNGWFRTGDLGHMDDQGFLYITGRASDMYISGGSNVYPREIEEKLLTHPDISEAAVLGMPDPLWGEVGYAVCVAKPGAQVTEKEMFAFVDGKMSRYKMPKRFIFWDALPKSAYGKITKKMIREELQARGELDRKPANDGPALRRLEHPGPPAPVRREAVRTELKPVAGVLRPGEVFLAGIARVFAEAGCKGGFVTVEGGACDPFRYVLPAFSPDAAHAAWYSATFAPAAGGRFQTATVIFGERDGAPFLHCHGIWDTGEDTLRMGHVLPFDSVVSQPVAVKGHGSVTATFDSVPDPETNFTLFSVKGRGEEGNGILLRVRPNEDVATAIEEVCRTHGIESARVYGIGSINEPVFEDGCRIVCLATEIAIESGSLEKTPEGLRTSLDAAVVDTDGVIYHGGLARGDNPVGVTFELVIVENRES